MTYDFHGSWDKKTGHNAPMFYCEGDDIDFFNTDSAVNYWIKSGFPARKIMLGLPIYGRSFTLNDPKNNGIGAPARDGGQAGKWTRAKGFLGYDDIDAVKFKMNYVKEKGLGGGMVWDVTMDDFKGNCGEGKNPFLTAMRRALA